jgi:hypothetical protein
MARYIENALTCIGEKMPRLPPRRIKIVQIRISILVHRVLVSNPFFSISSQGIQKSSPGFLKDESGFFPSPGFPSPRPIVPIKKFLLAWGIPFYICWWWRADHDQLFPNADGRGRMLG